MRLYVIDFLISLCHGHCHCFVSLTGTRHTCCERHGTEQIESQSECFGKAGISQFCVTFLMPASSFDETKVEIILGEDRAKKIGTDRVTKRGGRRGGRSSSPSSVSSSTSSSSSTLENIFSKVVL
jgi:hypothetical protein